MPIYNHDAIRKAYPDAVVINNNTGVFKEDGTKIEVEQSKIDAEVTRLNNAEPMRLLRLERNIRLTKTDYMALSDVTMTEAWKTYRQSLRDLPATASPKLDVDGNLDMSSVNFPTEPS